jgi:hypothetical protein
MLDQNLISSFHRSREYAAAQAELAKAAAEAERVVTDVSSVGKSTARLADEFDM